MSQCQKDIKLLEESPKEGHRDSEGSGGETIQGVAEGIWFSWRRLRSRLTGSCSSSEGSRGAALISDQGLKGMPGAVPGEDYTGY